MIYKSIDIIKSSFVLFFFPRLMTNSYDLALLPPNSSLYFLHLLETVPSVPCNNVAEKSVQPVKYEYVEVIKIYICYIAFLTKNKYVQHYNNTCTKTIWIDNYTVFFANSLWILEKAGYFLQVFSSHARCPCHLYTLIQ